ncbi:MAG: FxsA family protein [Bacteroidetes bacterium]|nr:FxsA family protein [Bacteroidota bacterium]
MKLLLRLLALFLVLPVVELALLVQIDKWIGFWPTIGLILVTGLVGSMLARHEGLSVWRRFNQRLAERGLPGEELLDGVIILVAGALLITPGVLTDVLGFLGLIPFTRVVIRKIVMKRIKRAVQRGNISVVGFQGGFGMASHNEQDGTEAPGWQGTRQDLPGYAEEAPDSV